MSRAKACISPDALQLVSMALALLPHVGLAVPPWLHLGRTDHAALAARIDELQAVLSIHYEVLVILECLFDFLPVLSDNHSEEHIS